jgi:tRNA-specific 2-thiouridylase
VPAEVLEVAEDRLELRLAEPHFAVTPGQSGALYRGPELVGGGRIR